MRGPHTAHGEAPDGGGAGRAPGTRPTKGRPPGARRGPEPGGAQSPAGAGTVRGGGRGAGRGEGRSQDLWGGPGPAGAAASSAGRGGGDGTWLKDRAGQTGGASASGARTGPGDPGRLGHRLGRARRLAVMGTLLPCAWPPAWSGRAPTLSTAPIPEPRGSGVRCSVTPR